MTAQTLIPRKEGNVVYLPAQTAARRAPEQEKRTAVARLKTRLAPGTLVYAVYRFQDPECDWVVCDFYSISGTEVTCLTHDIARATGQYDPRREVGLKLRRPWQTDPLRSLIEERLSLLLFGEAGALRHQAIA